MVMPKFMATHKYSEKPKFMATQKFTKMQKFSIMPLFLAMLRFLVMQRFLALLGCIVFAKIGDKLSLNKGKYIFATLNIDETLSEIEPICYKISFAVRVIELKLPIEQGYIESLVSELAKYDELIDYFHSNECEIILHLMKIKSISCYYKASKILKTFISRKEKDMSNETKNMNL